MKQYLIFSTARRGKRAYLAEIEFLDPSILPPIVTKFKKYNIEDRFFWKEYEKQVEGYRGKMVTRSFEKCSIYPSKMIPYKVLRIIQYATGSSIFDEETVSTKNRVYQINKFINEDYPILKNIIGPNEIYMLPEMYLENSGAIFSAENDEDASKYFSGFIHNAVLHDEVNANIRFHDMTNWNNMLHYSMFIKYPNFANNKTIKYKEDMDYNLEFYETLVKETALLSYNCFEFDENGDNIFSETELAKKYTFNDIFDFNSSVEELHKGYMFNGTMTNDKITKSVLSIMGALQNKEFDEVKNIFNNYINKKLIFMNHVYDEVRDMFPIPLTHIIHVFGCSDLPEVNIKKSLPNSSFKEFTENPEFFYLFSADGILNTPSNFIDSEIICYEFKEEPPISLKEKIKATEVQYKNYRKVQFNEYIRKK